MPHYYPDAHGGGDPVPEELGENVLPMIDNRLIVATRLRTGTVDLNGGTGPRSLLLAFTGIDRSGYEADNYIAVGPHAIGSLLDGLGMQTRKDFRGHTDFHICPLCLK